MCTSVLWQMGAETYRGGAVYHVQVHTVYTIIWISLPTCAYLYDRHWQTRLHTAALPQTFIEHSFETQEMENH